MIYTHLSWLLVKINYEKSFFSNILYVKNISAVRIIAYWANSCTKQENVFRKSRMCVCIVNEKAFHILVLNRARAVTLQHDVLSYFTCRCAHELDRALLCRSNAGAIFILWSSDLICCLWKKRTDFTVTSYGTHTSGKPHWGTNHMISMKWSEETQRSYVLRKGESFGDEN